MIRFLKKLKIFTLAVGIKVNVKIVWNPSCKVAT